MTTNFEEVLGVQSDNTGLVRLGNVSENRVDHSDDHAVLVGMAGVFDDRDNVRAFLGDVEKISSGTVREFDGVNDALL